MSELSAQTIRAGLPTRFVGQTVYYWPTVGSTNDELKRLAEAGAPEGTLAITEEQTAGRGRRGRRWIAPVGSSLLCSLLFRPAFLAPTQVQQLTMLCSLAAADAVTEVTGLQPGLKWPNDLVLNGKKLAGVLTELGFEGEKLAWVIVGLGLNVNVDFSRHRNRWGELSDTAISLMMALGHSLPRLPLLQSYLTKVETRYQALRSGHSPHREWTARLTTLGQSVTVTAPDGTHRGVAEGVDETGALLLRRSDGQVMRILTGDVTRLR